MKVALHRKSHFGTRNNRCMLDYRGFAAVVVAAVVAGSGWW